MNTGHKYFTHYANGHYWVAFDNGGIGSSFFSSPDGATWTSLGSIFTVINPNSFNNEWAVRYLGNTVIVAAFNSPNRTYRSGTLNSNGTVTWSAESAAGPADATFNSLNLLINNGRPIMWRDDVAAGGAGAIWRGSAIASPVVDQDGRRRPRDERCRLLDRDLHRGCALPDRGGEPRRSDRPAGDDRHSVPRPGRQQPPGGDEVERRHRHLRRLLVQRLDPGGHHRRRRDHGHRGPGQQRQREPEAFRRGAGLQREHPRRVREPQRRHGPLQEGGRLQQLLVADLGRDQPSRGEHRHGGAHRAAGQQPLSLLFQGRQDHLLPPLRRYSLGGGEPAPGRERHQPQGCAGPHGVGRRLRGRPRLHRGRGHLQHPLHPRRGHLLDPADCRGSRYRHRDRPRRLRDALQHRDRRGHRPVLRSGRGPRTSRRQRPRGRNRHRQDPAR